MEYKLKFANGRSSSIQCMEAGTPLQDKINAEEKRFSSNVTTINGKPVKEHALGGFIIGALLGAGAVGLTKRKPGVKKVYIKVPSGSSKTKPKSNKPKLSTFSKYLSKQNISEVKSTEGKEYKGTDILDGVHIKKDKFMAGGHVSKGEMVWKKLTPAKRLEFMNENCTPAITPRTQQTLSGKSYNFLPNAVKMMVESYYADVEEYKTGGTIEYVETERTDGIKGYTRAGALKRIKSLLKSDPDLRDDLELPEKISDAFLFDIGFEYYGFDYADLHEGEYGTGGKLTKNFTIDLNNLDRYIRSTQSRLENEIVETKNGQLFADKSRKALARMKEDYDYNWLKSQKDNYPSERWSDMVEMIDAYERWMHKSNEEYYGTDKFAPGGYTGTDDRIKKMVEHWNKYGWASGSFDGDDSEFFEAIGKTAMSTPITSQTGSDIKYYDETRVDSALRPVGRFAPGGMSDGSGIEWAKKQIKDRALFVAYYYWGGYNESSIWESFDKVYALSLNFVNSYDPDENWEDESFEEYMESFINENMPKK